MAEVKPTKLSIDVLGIFHSVTLDITRGGDKKTAIAKIVADGGFWTDAEDRFIPYQAVLGISVAS
jgi:hypothetical protein